jgi:DNA-binding response OmpR family regulator
VGSILIVESDPDTRPRIALALKEAGHDAQIAVTMREAFLAISEGGIDVVVIESYDPRVGVVELARSMDALPDAPPVILVSASPLAPEISVRIGAAMFVPKPYEPAELVTAIQRLLAEHRPVLVVDDEPTGPVRQVGS